MDTSVNIIATNYVAYTKEVGQPIMSRQDLAEDVLEFAFQTGIPLTDAEMEALVKEVECQVTFTMTLGKVA
jgi:hypothetical protein